MIINLPCLVFNHTLKELKMLTINMTINMTDLALNNSPLFGKLDST